MQHGVLASHLVSVVAPWGPSSNWADPGTVKLGLERMHAVAGTTPTPSPITCLSYVEHVGFAGTSGRVGTFSSTRVVASTAASNGVCDDATASTAVLEQRLHVDVCTSLLSPMLRHSDLVVIDLSAVTSTTLLQDSRLVNVLKELLHFKHCGGQEATRGQQIVVVEPRRRFSPHLKGQLRVLADEYSSAPQHQVHNDTWLRASVTAPHASVQDMIGHDVFIVNSLQEEEKEGKKEDTYRPSLVHRILRAFAQRAMSSRTQGLPPAIRRGATPPSFLLGILGKDARRKTLLVRVLAGTLVRRCVHEEEGAIAPLPPQVFSCVVWMGKSQIVKHFIGLVTWADTQVAAQPTLTPNVLASGGKCRPLSLPAFHEGDVVAVRLGQVVSNGARIREKEVLDAMYVGDVISGPADLQLTHPQELPISSSDDGASECSRKHPHPTTVFDDMRSGLLRGFCVDDVDDVLFGLLTTEQLLLLIDAPLTATTTADEDASARNEPLPYHPPQCAMPPWRVLGVRPPIVPVYFSSVSAPTYETSFGFAVLSVERRNTTRRFTFWSLENGSRQVRCVGRPAAVRMFGKYFPLSEAFVLGDVHALVARAQSCSTTLFDAAALLRHAASKVRRMTESSSSSSAAVEFWCRTHQKTHGWAVTELCGMFPTTSSAACSTCTHSPPSPPDVAAPAATTICGDGDWLRRLASEYSLDSLDVYGTTRLEGALIGGITVLHVVATTPGWWCAQRVECQRDAQHVVEYNRARSELLRACMDALAQYPPETFPEENTAAAVALKSNHKFGNSVVDHQSPRAMFALLVRSAALAVVPPMPTSAGSDTLRTGRIVRAPAWAMLYNHGGADRVSASPETATDAWCRDIPAKDLAAVIVDTLFGDAFNMRPQDVCVRSSLPQPMVAQENTEDHHHHHHHRAASLFLASHAPAFILGIVDAVHSGGGATGASVVAKWMLQIASYRVDYAACTHPLKCTTSVIGAPQNILRSGGGAQWHDDSAVEAVYQLLVMEKRAAPALRDAKRGTRGTPAPRKPYRAKCPEGIYSRWCAADAFRQVLRSTRALQWAQLELDHRISQLWGPEWALPLESHANTKNRKFHTLLHATPGLAALAQSACVSTSSAPHHPGCTSLPIPSVQYLCELWASLAKMLEKHCQRKTFDGSGAAVPHQLLVGGNVWSIFGTIIEFLPIWTA